MGRCISFAALVAVLGLLAPCTALAQAPPADVIAYIEASLRQQQTKIEMIQNSSLPTEQKRAEVAALTSKLFYAELNFDVPPEEGEMGVISRGITVKAFRVFDEFNMLVELSWFNDEFQTEYHRLLWAKGFSTRGVENGGAVALSGVIKVTGKRSYTLNIGEKAEHVEQESTVPVVEVYDISRYMSQAFTTKRTYDAIARRARLRADMNIPAAREETANAWLEQAMAFLNDGEPAKANRRLEMLLERFPNTEAAKKAGQVLANPPQTTMKQVLQR